MHCCIQHLFAICMTCNMHVMESTSGVLHLARLLLGFDRAHMIKGFPWQKGHVGCTLHQFMRVGRLECMDSQPCFSVCKRLGMVYMCRWWQPHFEHYLVSWKKNTWLAGAFQRQRAWVLGYTHMCLLIEHDQLRARLV
jgi:hypothetical protein